MKQPIAEAFTAYSIDGKYESTGEIASIVVLAKNDEEARIKARQRGIQVESWTPVVIRRRKAKLSDKSKAFWVDMCMLVLTATLIMSAIVAACVSEKALICLQIVVGLVVPFPLLYKIFVVQTALLEGNGTRAQGRRG